MSVATDSANPARTVVVLGGNGFVGSHVVRSFAERGFKVRSASRSGGKAAPGELGGPIESVRCDVRDPLSTAEALRGADVVVASFVGDRRTQIEGTANVLAALPASDGPPLLYLSTAEVYGTSGGRLDEGAPLCPQGWEYSDSKIEAEALCQRAAERGTRVTLFRPSIVYGPGAETWVVELGNNLMRGHWGTLGSLGEGTCNLLYVDDLVEALHLALASPPDPGEAFNLNGPDQVSWNELFSSLNRELGLPPLRNWSRSEALLRAGVGQLPRGLNALLGRLRGQRGSQTQRSAGVAPADEHPSLTERALATLKATPRLHPLMHLYPRQVVYLDGKARKLLGYVPRVSAREGIARSAAWYLAARGVSVVG